ncbi:hypothetical protein FOXG_22510 [Fusarium oxysporum f. sp. lycopersici 4287]|uniref:Uncharacterized protein n=1 Tax=Fusarium oxysporum f. sp. lycopersici (strain 4287 / CBS 123668 / FGSC 9935 / NRRL 34936) TaxID=426428 RepID=A0A0J9WVC3_FUSO4|nr:hypothetical protein FOXG_22510 [Fusarium oxysporum f. sp. lycopersici 4287]EWZ77667.1 hypothetical protein FOWG_17948 [Fusarium oxysporum f. sp. lycopersici MN25]KNB19282.1 hypothetical protein FOXG_22510 [Fusarium oxysporum f. sp. lycopersici 4287]
MRGTAWTWGDEDEKQVILLDTPTSYIDLKL